MTNEDKLKERAHILFKEEEENRAISEAEEGDPEAEEEARLEEKEIEDQIQVDEYLQMLRQGLRI
tara:strand:- start:853 stop:1047 length:195 start_codon:yes stop_codon:yes gene_type:complete